MRTASIERKTKETNISVEVNIDGTGQYDIKTGRTISSLGNSGNVGDWIVDKLKGSPEAGS